MNYAQIDGGEYGELAATRQVGCPEWSYSESAECSSLHGANWKWQEERGGRAGLFEGEDS